MPEHLVELGGLFLSAFISSTVAPGGSEAILAALVASKQTPAVLLVAIATMGNTLGALTTWWMGYYGVTRLKSDPSAEIPVKKQRALALMRRYGVVALLFSWLPLIGDGFCFAAGWLRLPLVLGAFAILVGKFARYAVIAALFDV